jgi:NADH-quinone oxidoreductase subunit H
VFFMAEYGSMVAVSGLAAILFFGGWNGPLPIAHWLGLDHGSLLGGIGNFLGLCNFLLKATMGVLVMMWARWTLPRLRIDQVMTTCLKYCVPLGAAMLLGAMLWTYAFPGGLILSSQTLLFTPACATGLTCAAGSASAIPAPLVAEQQKGR